MKRTALTAALLLVSLTLPSAALAAGATLTKQQVIARGTQICKAAERKVDHLPQIRSQNPFGPTAPKGDAARAIAFLAGYANALEGVRKGLAKLDPAPQGRALITGFVAQLGPTVGAFRLAHADALAGRYKAAMSQTQRGFSLFEKASVKTRAYGFPKGVCQAGSSG
jgi:hypothetical protein